MADERLRADLSRISEVSARVRFISDQFTSATELASTYSAALGSADLASAVDAFANGWAKHRAALITDLKDVASKSALAVSEYEKTDNTLARDARPAPGPGAAW